MVTYTTNNKFLYLLPNCLLLAVVLTGKVAVPEYWSRLKLDLLLRLFALNMMKIKHQYEHRYSLHFHFIF